MPASTMLRSLISCLVAGALAASALVAGEATITEVERSFVTYPFSDPSPLANTGKIYPYARFDGFTTTGVPQTWKLVKLENDWITVWVAPQIGGKVWGAVERASGKPFIYFNEVVKFRDVALRGPWTAGGVEFNLGVIGHAPTCATPVDHIVERHDDGSVSCTVGSLDLASRTEWRVVIRLAPDRAAFTTAVSWHNPTVFHQSCYAWMTGAAEAHDDLRVAHPGHHYLGHGGDAHDWPVDERGRDLSQYRQNTGGPDTSYHVVGQQAEHFGGWWPKRGIGYGHWALCGDLPGQKLWLWSQERSGALWRDLLTDAPQPQYIEMQAGLMHSQAAEQSSATPFKHAALTPGAALQWNEQWFPTVGIGGMVDASPWGALNVTRDGSRLEIGISPLQALDDELRVEVAGAVVLTRQIAAEPLKPVIVMVDLAGRTGVVAVSVGGRKLSWRSDDGEQKKLNRPLIAPAVDPEASEALFITGEEWLRQRNLSKALDAYRRCLVKEPHHLRALIRISELHLRRGEPELALVQARSALALDATDAEANLVYGAINRQLGQDADAKDGFGWAARAPGLRAVADVQLAASFMRERDWWRAGEFARRAAADQLDGQGGMRLLATLARIQQQGDEARRVQARLLALDPLSHVARCERWLLSPDDEARAAFTGPISGEFPHETFIEVAAWYADVGLVDDAVRVLGLSPAHPLVDGWLAWVLRERDQPASDAALARMLAKPVRSVFPFRLEELAVLRWAQQRQPHWKSAYYHGLLLCSLGRDEEARGLFAGCGTTPDEGAFYLNRSRLYRADQDMPRIAADLTRADALDASDWRASLLLARARREVGDHVAELAATTGLARRFPDHQAVLMAHAMALLANGRPADALAVLAGKTFLPFEGSLDGRDLHHQAQLLMAIAALKSGDDTAAKQASARAREWPERLGSGRPHETDERIEDFLVARLATRTGDEMAAKAAHTRAVAHPPAGGSLALLAALSLRHLGRRDEADALMAGWKTTTPSGALIKAWAEKMYAGDVDAARAVMARGLDGKPFSPWQPGIRDGSLPIVLALIEAAGP